MARSNSEKDYDYAKARLASTRPSVVEYFEGIAKEHRVTYAFNEKYHQPSYDEVTSNLSESANNWLGDMCRSSKPLHAFEEYLVKITGVFGERRRLGERVMPKAKSTRGADDSKEDNDEQDADIANDVTASLITTQGYDPLVPTMHKKLQSMLRLSKSCDITPCLDGLYMVRFTDASTRQGHIHAWRAVNLAERECSCTKWQDTKFPCIHAAKAAVQSGAHLSTLFEWTSFSLMTNRETYYYQFVPLPETATIPLDATVRVPSVVEDDDRVGGKRGRKPGPKPKHKRKSPRPGYAASGLIALQQ